MKSLSLLFLFIGSLMLVAGLTEQNMEKEQSPVIYKYVPKTLYDSQFEEYDLNKSMPALFGEDNSKVYRN